ncbi:BRO family protein [Streptosporangium sp. NPDC050855]|uniref:BRO family protein n=1 Tax=Streptosporangium sp. NPDC050855 TaxID=3366194 RepID=UPI0037AC6601
MNEIQPSGGASPFDAIKHVGERGEYWSAREMSPKLDYEQWRQFEDAIGRAMAAAENSGANVQDHFADARKITKNSRGHRREVDDFHLTRYGAYLVAMNCDPRKAAVAEAQTYFAVKTREAEIRAAERATPPPVVQDDPFKPDAYTWKETCTVIRQEYRVRVGVVDLRRTLMAAGVLNQQFEPKADFADCFWWTGTAYLVFRHCVPALWFHYREAKRKIQVFVPDARQSLDRSPRQGDLFAIEGGAS